MRFRNAAALSFALLGGCVADAGVGYQAQPVYAAPVEAPAPAADVQVEATVEEPEQPELVEVDSAPGVQIVYDAEVPVFYSDNYYWRNDGGIWYRSSVHTGGFVVYDNPPERIRHIDRPTQYAHYRPANYTPRAQRPGYVAPVHRTGTTTTGVRPGYGATRPATGNTGVRPATGNTGVRPAGTTYGGTRPATNPTYGTTRPATTTTVHPTGTNYGTTTNVHPAGTTTYGGAARPTTPTTTKTTGYQKPATPTTTKTTTKKPAEREKH